MLYKIIGWMGERKVTYRGMQPPISRVRVLFGNNSTYIFPHSSCEYNPLTNVATKFRLVFLEYFASRSRLDVFLRTKFLRSSLDGKC